MLDNHQKNIATFIHLSTFSRFIIPFGNFIGPIILWVANKDKSEFIDAHGKQAINFQISILLYAIILGTIVFHFSFSNYLMVFDFIDFHGFNDFHINIGKPSPLLYIGGGFGCIGRNWVYFRTGFYYKSQFKSKGWRIISISINHNF